MAYDWKINNLERNVSNGGVTTAHWTCTYTVEDDTVRSYGTVSFQPDADAADFIAYDDLTENNVLSWVMYSSEDFRKNVESGLSAQMEELKTPSTESGMPWSQE